MPDKHIIDRSSRKKLFFGMDSGVRCIIRLTLLPDSTGMPRPTVDSKGRRRRPGAKTLGSVLKCDDELFVDFIAKCLTWDPDRRLKVCSLCSDRQPSKFFCRQPGPALRHPFCARSKALAPAVIPPYSYSTSGRSLPKSLSISTPRRLEKHASESVRSVLSSYNPSYSSAGPALRNRTQSTTATTGITYAVSAPRPHVR